MCCKGWVKCEGMRSEELIICDGYFAGSRSVRIVSENSVKESLIRDGFLSLRYFLCVFHC